MSDEKKRFKTAVSVTPIQVVELPKSKLQLLAEEAEKVTDIAEVLKETKEPDR